MMATTKVTQPRAGEIGEPIRRFVVWPKETPVPVVEQPDHELAPEPIKVPEHDPVKVPA